MKENLAFGIGTGAFLAGIALLAWGTAGVQHGPKWEVPVQAATNLFLALIASFVLDVVAVLSYLWGDRFKSRTTIARWGYWLVLVLGITASVAICIFEPEQWPNKSPHLSVAVRAASIPIVLACGVLWVLFLVLGRKQFIKSR